MKKILWLINTYQPYFKYIEEAAQRQQLALDLITYDEVVISYQENEVTVSVNDQPFDDYQIVYFRNISEDLEKTIVIAAYCLDHSIKVYDAALNYTKPWIVSKNFAYLRFSALNLPIINTVVVSKKAFEEKYTNRAFPCVVKITNGAMGEGVHLCQNSNEVVELFNRYQRDLIIQDYIENDGDLRVFVIGDQIIGAMKRTSSDEKEFRNNISLGGTSKAVELGTTEIDLALAASKALGYTMAGVDLIFDQKNKKWLVVEVNKAPQFMGIMKATGINVPEKMVSFFAAELKNVEST